MENNDRILNCQKKCSPFFPGLEKKEMINILDEVKNILFPIGRKQPLILESPRSEQNLMAAAFRVSLLI
jgi:hypothetical protein